MMYNFKDLFFDMIALFLLIMSILGIGKLAHMLVTEGVDNATFGIFEVL